MIVVNLAPMGTHVGLKTTNNPRIGGGDRGVVSGFSKASRSRMMSRLSMLQKHRLPLFVTLTYPSKFPNVKQAKEHFRAFVERLRRAYPGFGFVWKLEYQKRGAPHFHLLLWGLTLAQARDFVPVAWFMVAGRGFPEHLAFHRGELHNKPCVEEIRSFRGVVSYASKYMTKDLGADPHTGEISQGRVWGIRGKVPFSPILQFRLDMDQALQFRRSVRRFTGLRLGRRMGFWCHAYCPDWLRLLDALTTPPPPPDAFPPGWWRGGQHQPPQEPDFLF